jgi:hypothetical protein
MRYLWQCGANAPPVQSTQGPSAISGACVDRKFCRKLRRDGGSQIAEAAMVLPILFMLLLSIYWFGRAFTIYGAINHAAREGARTAAVPVCANCGAGCPTTNVNSQLPCDKNVVDAVNSALSAAHIDPAQTLAFAPPQNTQTCPVGPQTGGCNSATGTSPSGQVTVCRNMVLSQTPTSSLNSAPVCGVIVSFQYPYQFVLPFASMSNQKILLKAQVEMRGED